jgi:nucleoside-diphosphate-sugar epimerase
MNILVTGGTGFVGTYLTRALLTEGHTVHLMGRDFSRVQALLGAGAIAVPVDLRSRLDVVRACQGMEVVCHVGALSAPWGKRKDFFGINVDGTHHLIEGCLTQGVRRLVQVSSPAVVFGGKDQILVPDQLPYPQHPTSLYALTKRIAEEAVLAQQGKLETIVLRPKAIYGPGDRALLPRLVAAARARRLPQIGDGHNQVDLTHVSDVVQALMLAVQRLVPDTAFPVYTVTSGEHVPLWEAIRAVLRKLGISDKLPKLPLPVALTMAGMMEKLSLFTGREPHLTRYSALILACTQTYNIERAKQDLGYLPRVGWQEGLETAL